MRRAVLVGFVLGVLGVMATPAEGATYAPGESGSYPTYTPQTIRVIDAMWVRDDHLQQWYAGRNAAFAEWTLPFVIELGTVPYRWTDETINSGLAIQDIVPNAIVIVRNYSTACQNVGGFDASLDGGIVVLCPWAPWWKQQSAISQAVGHEAGHALGFAHGGNGIMAGAVHVNDEERALARTYFEAAGFVW